MSEKKKEPKIELRTYPIEMLDEVGELLKKAWKDSMAVGIPCPDCDGILLGEHVSQIESQDSVTVNFTCDQEDCDVYVIARQDKHTGKWQLLSWGFGEDDEDGASCDDDSCKL